MFQPRHVMVPALAALLMSSTAFAQDATIYYTPPTVQAGQPVVPAAAPTIQAVPVYTPVPVAVPVMVDGYSAPAPTPATVDDADYLGAPSVQVSQYDQSVRFVSGGIGGYEKTWIEKQSKDYALKVTYADTTGHYLAGVNVTLTDAKGATLLTAITEGPYLLVKAKPGTYTLASTYMGVTKTTKVTLGKSLSRTSVTFTDSES